MKIQPFLIPVIISVCINTYAQKKWSLSECIEFAHANNLQIKRTELQASLAELDLSQAKMGLFPDLNANIERNYSFGRQVNPGTNEYTENNFLYDVYMLNSNLALFNGFQNFNRISRNNFTYLAALQNVEKEKIEIMLAVSSAYLQILFRREYVAMAERQCDVTEQQVERTGRLVEAGKVAQGDLLEIRAQLARERLSLTYAQNRLQMSFIELTQLLDIDSLQDFDILTPDETDLDNLPSLPEISEVYSDAISFLPHVKMAEHRLHADSINLRIQKGRRSPEVYLSGSFYTLYANRYFDGTETTDYPYRNQIQDNFAQSVSLGINVPIFNRGEVNADISRARIQLEETALQLEQVKQGIFKDIQKAYSEASTALYRYQAAADALDSYRESFHYAEEKYSLGALSSIELSMAKNNYIRAESELLQAKYEYLFGLKILDIYRGRPVGM